MSTVLFDSDEPNATAAVAAHDEAPSLEGDDYLGDGLQA